MSISIKNLYYDQREVGKTIKATKKYYVWEFVLNGKYHKVEMFHSKLSAKKKLCLDAQVIIEDKGYKSDFQYSFKVGKNYFNITQTNSDKFELRIDNKEFSMIMQEERTGKLREPEPEKAKTPTASEFKYGEERANSSSKSKGITNPRNSNPNFYANEEQDFDFGGGSSNTGSVIGSRVKSTTVAMPFGEYSNSFKNNLNQNTQKQTVNMQRRSSTGAGTSKGVTTGVLLDFSEITESKPKVQVTDQKTILSQINFSASEINPEIVKHNQNIINNLKIFGEEDQNEELQPTTQQPYQPMNMRGSITTTEDISPNFNSLFSNTTNTVTNNNNNSMTSKNRNPMTDSWTGTRSSIPNQQKTYELVNPTISMGNINEMKKTASDNNLFTRMSNSNSSPNQINLLDSNVNIGSTSEGSNEFKNKIASSGLIDLNNILEDKKKNTNVNPKNTAANYNFAFGSSPYGNVGGTSGYVNNPYSNPYAMNMNMGGFSNMNSGYGMSMGGGMNMGMNPYGQMPYNQYVNTNTIQMNPNTVPSMENMNTSKSPSNISNAKKSSSTPFDI